MPSIYLKIAECVEKSKERIFNGLTGYDVEVVNSDFLILQLRKLAEEDKRCKECGGTETSCPELADDFLNKQREVIEQILFESDIIVWDRLKGKSLASEIVQTLNELK